MTTLPMQYFGRGSARIMMPRAVTRRARREWVVSPSFMILVLSLAFFALHKVTFNEPLKLKRPRTIIVLPQAPAIPKPTVEEKISFIKVVKDAARKSAVPRKEELKRALEPPRPLPNTPVPPLSAKPKKISPPKAIAPPKKLITPLDSKRVGPIAAQKERLPQKVPPAPVHTSTPPPVSLLSSPLQATQRRPKVTPPSEKKGVSLTVAANPMAKVSVMPSGPTPKITQMAAPAKRLAPVQAVTTPSLKENTHMKRVASTQVPPKKSFSPLPMSRTAPAATADRIMSKGTPVMLASAPRKSGPAPTLTQLSAPASVATAPPASKSESASHAPGGRPSRPVLDTAPPSLSSAAAHHRAEDSTGVDVNALVQIQGSTLGQSLRVLNLKEEIYRKTSRMPATNSPYTYRIHTYQCTLVISGGPLPSATLTFEPSDAPFEVVSALERLLPRRTM
ncbi:hypothetical protein DSLASN_14910 [Desulfoluna limicola]|uniref:Uncharacterized protein n=1 Tax=Desulfoluna limicola TaxID=2810562 RepID=A0ABM7PFB2_9BACT|nr:hypothetical protein [Desulfoluna limicola]BCS95859.1 hypothetical protein DSLASN_14910 [Desulfoluna limicola]